MKPETKAKLVLLEFISLIVLVLVVVFVTLPGALVRINQSGNQLAIVFSTLLLGAVALYGLYCAGLVLSERLGRRV